jgi:aminoglycoside 6'-N-acetyltransferase I
MQIVDLQPEDQVAIYEAANLLVEGFKEHWPQAWPDIEAALAEVQDSFQPDRISRIAIDAGGTVLGWIGAIPEYNGNAWELHPLVVHPGHQGQGIGRALVADLGRLVCQRGGITLYLGTDDEDNMTSLGGIDLYPDVLRHVANIKNRRRHPYEFYQKLGFVIVGVIPDANGPGKPDIIMAKRLITPAGH